MKHRFAFTVALITLHIAAVAAQPRRDGDASAWTPGVGSADTASDDKGQLQTAITPLLDRAYARLKSMPTPPPPRAVKAAMLEQLPDQMQVRRMLRKGDIGMLKRYLPKLYDQYERGDASERYLYEGLTCLYAVLPEALPALDDWVKEAPKSYVARLARGIVRSGVGWDARGTDLVRYTPEKNFQEMKRWHGLAAEDFVSSLGLSSRPIPSIAGLLSLAQARSKVTEATRLFDEGLRIAPASSALFGAFEPMVEHDWGGGTLANAAGFLALAKKSGVDAGVWSDLQRGIDNARSGNLLSRDQKEARAYLIKFTQQYNTFDGWLTLANTERQLGLYDDAQKSFDRAAAINPNTASLFERRAQFFEQRGMLPDAIADYKRAAALESKWAYEKLIFAYLRGALGLQKDLAVARSLCEESAAIHQPAGEFCLGYLYREGLAGFAKNIPEAAKWERLAAHHGNAPAANDIGYRLLHGEGVAPDRAEAIFWLRKSARSGFEPAITKLRNLGVPIEEPEKPAPALIKGDIRPYQRYLA